MKKTLFFATAGLLLSIGASTLTAQAVELPQSVNSKGTVSFKASEKPNPPVDPENPDPENPVDPEQPPTGTAGPLSIDYVSNFKFGEQEITTKDETYAAATEKIQPVNSEGKPTGAAKQGPMYVQITDKRGTLAGWKLSLKQNAQFMTADKDELAGASLKFTKAEVASNIDDAKYKPTAQAEVALVPGTEVPNVVDAAKGQGAGTWVYRFGSDEASAKDAVKLEIPGKTVKLAKEYSTELTWTLSSTPDNGSENP